MSEFNGLVLISALATLSCAALAGFFLAFSEIVLKSIDKASDASSVEVMQIINRQVYRTLFMVLLIGMSVLSLIVIWLGWLTLPSIRSGWLVAGGSVYLAMVFACTLFGNVPLNNQLETMKPSDPAAMAFWSRTFYSRWLLFNHIRTLGCAISAVCFLAACIAPAT